MRIDVYNNNKREEYILLKGIDPDILSILKEVNCYIIGGAITSVFTNQSIKDYDIYCCTATDAYLLKEAMSKKAHILNVSSNAITYKCKDQLYQVITRFVGYPQEIFRYFDFTVCMGAYSIQDRTFILHENFLKHISQRRLYINHGTQYPICTLIRVNKYIKKGYKISNSELLKLGLTINKLNITTYHDLKEHMQGIDTLLLKELTDLLLTPEYKEAKFDFEKAMELINYYLEKALSLGDEEE